MKHRTRRGLIRGMGALSISGLAGCSVLSNTSPPSTPTPAYDHLERTATYVSDDVGLRLPDKVPRVESPTFADLIVLHGNPGVDGEQVVTWLVDERWIALLGDRSQETWLTWTQQESYRDTFGDQERSRVGSTPHLLVATASETTVSTGRFSWSDLPTNSELVQALEEALANIAP